MTDYEERLYDLFMPNDILDHVRRHHPSRHLPADLSGAEVRARHRHMHESGAWDHNHEPPTESD